MYDKNGKPIGILAHEIKTHVTNSDDKEMLASLNKDLYNVKINDRFSNGELLSYSNSREITNKQNILADSLDTAHHIKKFTESKNHENEQKK